MSEPTKKMPTKFSMTPKMGGVGFKEVYVFHNAVDLENFAKTAPFGERFILKIEGTYYTKCLLNLQTHPDKQAFKDRMKELTECSTRIGD